MIDCGTEIWINFFFLSSFLSENTPKYTNFYYFRKAINSNYKALSDWRRIEDSLFITSSYWSILQSISPSTARNVYNFISTFF